MGFTKDDVLVVQTEDVFYFLAADAEEGQDIPPEEGEEEVLSFWKGAIAEPLDRELLGDFILDENSLTLLELSELLDEEGETEAKVEDTKAEEDGFAEPKKREEPIHKMEAPDSMKIKFDSIVWDKMRTWIEMTRQEISGLGCVRREADGTFHVYDIFLVKQENTGTFTDIEDEALHSLMWELMQLDDEDGGSRYSDLKFWWHSHANMGVTWSGQDDRCIAEKLQHGADWWLSAVLNIPGKISTRLDTKNPPMRFDSLKVDITHVVSDEVKEWCRKEYEEKVTEKTYSTVTAYGSGFQSGYGYGYGWNGDSQGSHPSTRAANTRGYYGKGSPATGGGHGYGNGIEPWNKASASERVQSGAQSCQGNAGCEQQAAAQRQAQTQAKGQGQKQFTSSLGSRFTGEVVYPSKGDIPATVGDATPKRAAELYTYEIEIIKQYLDEKKVELGLGVMKYKGLMYYPREDRLALRGMMWTMSGQVSCNDNNYVAVAWKEDPGVVNIFSIEELYSIDNRKPQQITIPTDRFAPVVIETDPDWSMLGSSGFEVDLDQCVGLIFSTQSAWPEDALGQEFFVPDTITIVDEPPEKEEPASGNKSLFKEVIEYAEGVQDQELLTRIISLTAHAHINTVIDVLETLSTEMGETKEEKALEEEAGFLTRDEILAWINKISERNPQQAFPWVWNTIPCTYMCPHCFEPVEADDEECGWCKEGIDISEEDKDG